MFAIFSGKCVFDGISPSELIDDKEIAEEKAIAMVVDGGFAEVVEVQDPASLDDSMSADVSGNILVVFSSGLASGATVFGPFSDHDLAMDFAEEQRGEDEEYEIMEVPGIENTSHRYIHGCWPHIFESMGEKNVRFVYDTVLRSVLYGQIEFGWGWRNMNADERADILDSLHNGNEEALDDPEEHGLEDSDELPDWAQQ